MKPHRTGPFHGHRHGWDHWHERWQRLPLAVVLARGVHRKVFASVVLATLLGLGIGTIGATHGHGVFCLLALVLPLSGWASRRIARPLADLARVAEELRQGRLGSRGALPEARGDADVAVVTESLRALSDRLSKQLADQRALLAAVSHELRSPLGRVRVLVELSRDGVAPPAFHDDVQREVDGMDQLVADLLAAARIDFEAVAPRALPAREVGERALALARLPASLLVAPDVTVDADPTLLARALAVLLDNGRRHGGRVVRLAVVASEDAVRFLVDDDGPGFPEGEVARAFQPFWRGSNGARTDGVGLGLALVRQIALAHGGEAGCQNRPEGGARVWLELPRRIERATP